jgi:pimeloyl-ACP methyl ester carboxylesterase
MPEQIARAGDVELAYETFGDPAHPALLLVMGLGTQMLGWREDFCTLLAERGFQVIRYDNRDVGRSTKMPGRPPTTWQLIRRDRRAATYQLTDMANDAIAILDHLGIAKAHVVGASMGGMIAQLVAIRHPERVRSLTSIMSTTGDPSVGMPAEAAMGVLLAPPATDRASAIERALDT